MATCPWEAKLPFLDSDTLDLAEFESIEQHVEACATCQQSLETRARMWGDGSPTMGPPMLLALGRFPRIPGLEIDRELGRGAMGVIYLATQTGLDRQVAVKVLPGAMAAESQPIAQRRWQREARAASKVRHPNVVPLYSFGEGDGWFYLVFEYIPGGTLKARLTEPIPPRAAARLIGAIAQAVAQTARTRGIAPGPEAVEHPSGRSGARILGSRHAPGVRLRTGPAGRSERV